MTEQPNVRLSELVARAWADEQFLQELLADPKSVLPEYGITVAADTEVRVLQSTDKVVYFTLPAKPSEELSDEKLDLVAGGMAGDGDTYCCCCAPCCCCCV